MGISVSSWGKGQKHISRSESQDIISIGIQCAECHTLRPTMATLPSPDQVTVKPSPPSWTVAIQVLLRTSQNRQVPSLETDASSASLVGFHATRSMAAVWPRSSVLFLTCGFSGFQMRSVRSAEPVAIRCPVGFHAMVRILHAEMAALGVDFA